MLDSITMDMHEVFFSHIFLLKLFFLARETIRFSQTGLFHLDNDLLCHLLQLINLPESGKNGSPFRHFNRWWSKTRHR